MVEGALRKIGGSSHMSKYSEVAEMSDSEIDEYLLVAFAMGNTTGFSKGTADVSPADLKKLRPLVRFYAKKAKPFTACVNDNRKRFGPLTNKYCAIIKDLIVGNTKWRNQGGKKNLSEDTLKELFALNVPDHFFMFLSELEEEDIQAMMIDEVEKPDDADEFSSDHIMAEMFFANESAAQMESDSFVWKPIIREGEWKFSPSANGPVDKPIKVVRDGQSDRKKLIISMAELKENFEAGAVEHVTIPASHADTVLENTGFIRKLRITEDDQGRAVLEAGMEFTEPDVKEKALRGTIANTSAGILYDYVHKETGNKFRSVLAHAALTNRPWLNGMKPFGINASEDNLEIIGFSEEPIESSERREDMPEKVESTIDLSELGFADADALKAALSEGANLRKQARERDVTDLCKTWQEDGKSAALVAEAQQIMMSDEGANVLNLSEDSKTVSLTASDIVKRLMDKVPAVNLSNDPVTPKDASDEKPGDSDEVELSQEEKALATKYFFDGMTEKEAIAKAKVDAKKEVSQ
jgi:phage I-like protein